MHAPWTAGYRRVAQGLGAFVLTDLITGMAAFSVITLGSLWFFSMGYLTIAHEYAVQGIVFGSAMQTTLAWVGVFVALPLIAPTLALAVRAYRLPVLLFRSSLSGTRLGSGLSSAAVWSRIRMFRGWSAQLRRRDSP